MLIPFPDDFSRCWRDPDPGTVEGALFYTGQDDELDEAREQYRRRGSNVVDLDAYPLGDPKRVTLEDA